METLNFYVGNSSMFNGVSGVTTDTEIIMQDEIKSVTITVRAKVTESGRIKYKDEVVCKLNNGQLHAVANKEGRDQNGTFVDCDYKYITDEDIPFSQKEIEVNQYIADTGDGSEYYVKKVIARQHSYDYVILGLKAFG